MSYRFMRVLVFFDLPTETAEERRAYRLFRKTLITNGFFMMQESVYCRLLMNAGAGKSVSEIIRKNAPVKGIVQLLTVTEKQFAAIEYLVGKNQSDVISTDERVVIV